MKGQETETWRCDGIATSPFSHILHLTHAPPSWLQVLRSELSHLRLSQEMLWDIDPVCSLFPLRFQVIGIIHYIYSSIWVGSDKGRE